MYARQRIALPTPEVEPPASKQLLTSGICNPYEKGLCAWVSLPDIRLQVQRTATAGDRPLAVPRSEDTTCVDLAVPSIKDPPMGVGMAQVAMPLEERYSAACCLIEPSRIHDIKSFSFSCRNLKGRRVEFRGRTRCISCPLAPAVTEAWSSDKTFAIHVTC